MKLKKKIIVILAKNGGAEMLIRGLDLKDEYKVINFRKSIRKILNEIVESEKELSKQCNLTEGKNGNLEGDEAELKKFREFQKELYEEEVEIDCKAISFESWHTLKMDNIALAIREVEEALEGGFWTAPAEEENNS